MNGNIKPIYRGHFRNLESAQACADYLNKMMVKPEKVTVEKQEDEYSKWLSYQGYHLNLGTQVREYRITLEKLENAITDFTWGWEAAKGNPYGT